MDTVLTLNGGSSTIRFAVYDARDTTAKLVEGKIERIDGTGATLEVTETHNGVQSTTKSSVQADAGESTAAYLARWLSRHPCRQIPAASGIG